MQSRYLVAGVAVSGFTVVSRLARVACAGSTQQRNPRLASQASYDRVSPSVMDEEGPSIGDHSAKLPDCPVYHSTIRISAAHVDFRSSLVACWSSALGTLQDSGVAAKGECFAGSGT